MFHDCCYNMTGISLTFFLYMEKKSVSFLEQFSENEFIC